MVQRLELYASTTRGMGSISGWGTQILHAMWCSRKKKKKRKEKHKRENFEIDQLEGRQSELNPMSQEACDQVRNLGGSWACGEF